MNVSGVIQFEGLTGAGLRTLREFESKNLPGIRFTFGPSSDTALVCWDSFVRLAVVSRMAGIVAGRETLTDG